MTTSKVYKIAAMVILGLMEAFWLFSGFRSVFSGDSNWIKDFILVIVVGILGMLSWKWPLPGGIFLALLGVVVAMYYLLVLYDFRDAIPAFLLISTPMVISGYLLIESDWQIKRRKQPR